MEMNLHIVVKIVISNGCCTIFLEDLNAVCLRWQLMLFNTAKHRTFTFFVVTGEI